MNDDPVIAAQRLAAVEAELSSAALRDRILALFARFERHHGLPRGFGQKFQLNGYRA
jgi:hypothetical protein